MQIATRSIIFSLVFGVCVCASTVGLSETRLGTQTHEFFASLVGGEVVASHGQLPSQFEIDISQGSGGCRRDVACGKAFVAGVPDGLGVWLALIDLHLQIGGNVGGERTTSHRIASMTEDITTQLKKGGGTSATETLREVVQFQPKPGVACAAQLEIFSLRDVLNYQFVDRDQLQRLGAGQSANKELERRNELGIGPSATGELFFRHHREGGVYEMQLYFASEYDARKWGEGLAIDRVLRCRSEKPISAERFSRYSISSERLDSDTARIVATENAGR